MPRRKRKPRQPGNEQAYHASSRDNGQTESIQGSAPIASTQVRQGENYGFLNPNRFNLYETWNRAQLDGAEPTNLATEESIDALHEMYLRYSLASRGQSEQIYFSSPSLDTRAPPFQSSQARGSLHPRPQAPSLTDSTLSWQISQAQDPSYSTPPQPTTRYALWQRRPDQIAQYSTAALAGTLVQSVETSHRSTSTLRLRAGQTRQPADRDGRTAPRAERVDSPPTPAPTANYLKNAELPPTSREAPQKLLVVLDLNGTLLVRPQKRKNPTKFKERPGVTQLLDYLFVNHVVMVYSSAIPQNTNAMVNKLIQPTHRDQMAGVWARDKLDLTKLQYDNKVQVYKKLQKIWADKTIQTKSEPGRRWDQSNTILVDDSQSKALAQPHNLLQVPEFEDNAPHQKAALQKWRLEQEEIVKSLEQKLEELKWQVDVSRLIREWQTGKTTAPGVVDETVDQKTHHSLQRRDSSDTQNIGQPQLPPQLLSPRSPSPSDSDSSEDEASTSQGVNLDGDSLLDKLERDLDLRLNLNLEGGLERYTRPGESATDKNGAGRVSQERGAEEAERKWSLFDVSQTPDSMKS